MGLGERNPRRPPANAEHPSVLQHYRSITGWQSVCIWWNPDMGGYPEPWETGGGPYDTEQEAIDEAKAWAVKWELQYQGRRG